MSKATAGLLFTFGAFAAAILTTACPKQGAHSPLDASPAMADEPAAYAAMKVETALVQSETVDAGVEYSGSVVAAKSAMVAPKLMALIEEMPVSEGDVVTKGALIARLDKRDLDAQMVQARAAVTQAEAGYSQAQAAVAEGEAGLAQAQAAYDLADKNLKRYQALYAEDSISKAQLEEVQANFEFAKSGLQQARKKIDQAKAGASRALAGKTQAEAQVASIEIMMSYAEVRAPFGGVIAKKFYEVGAMTAPGQPIVRIESHDELEIEIAVPESDLGGIKAGDPIGVLIDALGESVPGKVKALVTSGDPMTHTFKLRIELPPGKGVLPGMFGRIMLGAHSEESLTISDGAIVERGAVKGVFKVTEEKRAAFVPIEFSPAANGRVRVLRGIERGARVILNPPAGLADGMEVEYFAGD